MWDASGAHAAGNIDDQKRIIYVNFDGGWDQLMAFDPRDHNQFGSPSGYIYSGYDILALNDATTAQLIANGGSGLVQPSGSNIAFGPAIGELANRYADLCVLRGVNMGTLTHEVGRRYFLTGKFPSGLNASGDAIATVIAGQCPDASSIPNMVVGGVETYNVGFDPKASGVVVTNTADLGFVLKPVNAIFTLDDPTQAALANYQAHDDCISQQLDATGMVHAYRASWEKSQALMSGDLFAPFNFKPNPPAGSKMELLYNTFNITNLNQALAGPIGQGLIAAQAITEDVALAVSIQPAPRLDHHDGDWEDQHLPGLRDAFDVIASLIDFLKTQPHAKGGSYFDHTIIMMCSDFARTPNINVRGGRDHHLASSCVLAGGGVVGNQVIGATSDDLFATEPIDPLTGQVSAGGIHMRPPDIHATVLQAMGVPADHLSNQSPVIIDKILT